jgi:hypothetical protein
MPTLSIRPADQCKYDIVSLGEVMIRFDPGDERIHTTRHFRVWEGGGEYNVARGLKRCFGKEAAVVTAIPCSQNTQPKRKCRYGLRFGTASERPFRPIDKQPLTPDATFMRPNSHQVKHELRLTALAASAGDPGR